MSELDWGRVESLFHEAMEQPAAARNDWLQAQCVGEPELFQYLRELIDQADDGEEPVPSLIASAAERFDRLTSPRPRRLGRFRILQRIGQGGMGTVYLAERDDEQFRQRVAIKVIRGFPGDQALERLRRERQILADLQHPNIARLLDGGATLDGQPYLVMEYIDGRPIGQWCQEAGLDLRQRVRLLLAVCDAIHHAHQHLIVHRDIKPGNILVTEEGRPVVMDFGIAKLLNDESSDLTGAMRFCTPGYASPEQLANGPVTTATDVFSLGRLLLHVILAEAIDEDRVQAGKWRRSLPRDLVAIIDQATRQEPELRYASVAAVRADLIRFLDGRTVAAVPDRLTYRLLKSARRHRAGLAAALLIIVIASSLSWRWALESERARSAEARMATEAQHAGQVLDFMLDAISWAEPGRSLGEEISVRNVLDRGYEQLLEDEGMSPVLRARLLLALGEVYLRMEMRERARELLEQASLTVEPATAVRSLSLLGFSLTLDRQLDAARLALDRAFEIKAQAPSIAATISNELGNHQGLWLLADGQTELARDVFAELVDLHQAAGERELASRLLHNLGLAYNSLAQPELARQQFQHSLDLKSQTVGELHPSFANTLQNLARSEAQLGNYRAAGDLLNRSLSIRSVLFGQQHSELHADYNELGNMHHDAGDFERAIEKYRLAIDLHADSGASDLAAAIYFNNLASALEDRGEWLMAEGYFRQSLALRLAGHGNDHPSTALARHNLARLLIRLGRFQEARVELESSLEFRRAHFGPTHHVTAYTESLAALLELGLGRPDLARDQLEASLAVLTDALPARNWWVLVTRGHLARVQIELGALEMAERQLAELIDDYRSAFGPGHPHAAVLALDLARVHLLRSEPGPAAELLEGSRVTLEASLHPDSQASRQWRCLHQGQVEVACWR